MDKLRALERRAGWPVRLGMTPGAAEAACRRVGQWSEQGQSRRCTVVAGPFHHELELCGGVACVSRLVVTGASVPSRFEAIARDLSTHYGSPTEDVSSAAGRRIVYRFDPAHSIELHRSVSADELRLTLRAALGSP